MKPTGGSVAGTRTAPPVRHTQQDYDKRNRGAEDEGRMCYLLHCRESAAMARRGYVVCDKDEPGDWYRPLVPAESWNVLSKAQLVHDSSVCPARICAHET